MSVVVRVEHLRAALAPWTYAEAGAWIFSARLGLPLADTIYELLRAGGPLTETEINQGGSRATSPPSRSRRCPRPRGAHQEQAEAHRGAHGQGDAHALNPTEFLAMFPSERAEPSPDIDLDVYGVALRKSVVRRSQ